MERRMQGIKIALFRLALHDAWQRHCRTALTGGPMTLLMRCGFTVAGVLALGTIAIAQPSVPDCRSEKMFGEWKVAAQTTNGLISLPSRLLEPRTRDAFGDGGSFEAEDRSLLVSHSRPGGTIKNLPQSGIAVLRFSHASETLEFRAPFTFKSYPESPGHWAARDAVSMEVKKPGSTLGLVGFLTRAEKLKARVELTAQTGNTIFMKYSFATSGFEAAIRWAETEKQSLAALHRANKCRIPSLF
jgi:hypothetical protein